jgi:autotransporter-associated beta strand protein
VALPGSDGVIENPTLTAFDVNGAVSGPGNLVKSGTGVLRLNGADTHSGSTLIQSGTLALGVAASIGDSSNIVVSSGAVFDVTSLPGGFSLGAGQTLSGHSTQVELSLPAHPSAHSWSLAMCRWLGTRRWN